MHLERKSFLNYILKEYFPPPLASILCLLTLQYLNFNFIDANRSNGLNFCETFFLPMNVEGRQEEEAQNDCTGSPASQYHLLQTAPGSKVNVCVVWAHFWVLSSVSWTRSLFSATTGRLHCWTWYQVLRAGRSLTWLSSVSVAGGLTLEVITGVAWVMANLFVAFSICGLYSFLFLFPFFFC